MRNLFEFATKELSQDAFLRWLFENYDCENEKVRNVCYKLLNYMLGTNFHDGEIEKIKTYVQWKRIDLLVEIYSKKENIVVAIEDKVFASEHDNQLRRYSQHINDWYNSKQQKKNNWKIKKIFYKTALEDKKDIEAGKKWGWDFFFIKEIYDFFINKEFDDTESELLNFYISHIRKLYKDLTEISSDNMETWNRLNFRTYLNKTFVEPYSVLYKHKENISFANWEWRNIYSSMAIIRKLDNKTSLFLEIVTRPKSEGASVKISTEKKSKNGNEVEFKIKEMLKNFVNENMYVDKETDEPLIKIVKSKKEIAKSNEELNNRLLYKTNRIEFESTIRKIIEWFISISDIDLYTISKEYSIKEYKEPKSFKYIIIKVRDDFINSNLKSCNNNKDKARYITTRSCWKIKKPNVEEYPYVFSVTNGIVREIYKVDEWNESKRIKGRFEFTGKRAGDSKKQNFFRNNYINKKLPSIYMQKGLAQPVLKSRN